MDKNVTILIATVIVALAILGAAFMFTHESEPAKAPPPTYNNDQEIACLEGGGTWNLGSQACEH